MDLGLIYMGLYITGVGVAIVFGVLSVLVVLLLILKQVYYKPSEKKTETIKKEETVAIERLSGKTDPKMVALISAAITAFNEYKASRLRKYELFKEFPELARLLPMAGVLFKSKIKVSFGGRDVLVEVEESPNNTYKVRVGGKTYIVSYSIQ